LTTVPPAMNYGFTGLTGFDGGTFGHALGVTGGQFGEHGVLGGVHGVGQYVGAQLIGR
jgi:hypothetical protein